MRNGHVSAEIRPLLAEPSFNDDSLPSADFDDVSIMSSGSDDSSKLKLTTLQRWNKKRLQWVYRLDSSSNAKWWDMIDVILSIMFVSSYILLTLLSVDPNKNAKVPPPPPQQIYQDIDFWISVLLFVQWGPRIYLTLDPIKDLQTMWSISTLVSSVSVFWVYFGFALTKDTFLEGGPVVFLFPFRFLRFNSFD